jgi:hypothetical protein
VGVQNESKEGVVNALINNIRERESERGRGEKKGVRGSKK